MAQLEPAEGGVRRAVPAGPVVSAARPGTAAPQRVKGKEKGRVWGWVRAE